MEIIRTLLRNHREFYETHIAESGVRNYRFPLQTTKIPEFLFTTFVADNSVFFGGHLDYSNALIFPKEKGLTDTSFAILAAYGYTRGDFGNDVNLEYKIGFMGNRPVAAFHYESNGVTPGGNICYLCTSTGMPPTVVDAPAKYIPLNKVRPLLINSPLKANWGAHTKWIWIEMGRHLQLYFTEKSR